MSKRKSKNKMKNWITSLIIFIILCITGYYGTDYFDIIDNNQNETKITVATNIENSNIIDFANDKLNIIFFYVGQADSIFIKLNDCSMLIDAGNNDDGPKIVEFLKQKEITTIDYLIGTHSDEDHIGGLDDIIKELNIKTLYIPTVGIEGKDYKNTIETANAKNVKIENPVRGDIFYLNQAKCEVMSALEGNISDNNSSIVIQMNYNNTSYLFMGDSEKEVENSRSWNRVDILKVGHHGSNSSSSDSFLAQVNPKYSIIQVGKNNSYNLPSSKAIERLEKIGTKILRTDKANGEEEGSLLLTSDGNSIDIKTVNINLDGNS